MKKMAYQIHATDYFLSALKSNPNGVALCDENKQLTYAELNIYARKIASQLLKLESKIRLPVAIALPKGMNTVAAILGIQMAGHIYVPLDIQSPQQRLNTILQKLGDPLLITSSEILDKFNFNIEKKRILVIDEVQEDHITEFNPLPVIDADPLYVIFTSGSTGTPKGVTISHRSVIDYIEWAKSEYQISISDVMMNQAPFYFDNSTLDLYLTWASCSCLFIPDEKVYMFPIQILEAMNKHHVTTVFWVPSVLVSIANSALLPKHTVASLKNILFAGEPMPIPQINTWIENYPNALFSNLYGPTELTVDCTAYTFNAPCIESTLPIGYPCRNTDVLVLSDKNNLCVPGEIGELCVRGSSLSLGYWNDITKTNEVFIQNPSHNLYRDLIYRTGDLVRMDEKGLIYFIGRKDTQIKHMGYRIELGEIEAAVRRHPNVGQACVVYLYDSRRIACAVTCQQGTTVELVGLKKFLLGLVPKYMIPNQIFVLENIPINANGKINRTEVSALFQKEGV